MPIVGTTITLEAGKQTDVISSYVAPVITTGVIITNVSGMQLLVTTTLGKTKVIPPSVADYVEDSNIRDIKILGTPVLGNSGQIGFVWFSHGEKIEGSYPVGLPISGNLSVLTQPWFDAVDTYGADPTGATDSAGAIQAAINAASAAGGGLVILRPGTYTLIATINWIYSNVNLWCPGGSQATKLNYAGSGDAIRIDPSLFTVLQGPTLEGFTLAGGAIANTNGIHIIDTIGLALVDVVIENFTGATSAGGLVFDNVAKFCERATLDRVHLNNNRIGISYNISGSPFSSFGYHKYLDVRFNVNNNQFGIVVNNGANPYNHFWDWNANVADAGTLIYIANGGDLTTIDCHCFAEQTSGVGGTSVNVQAGGTFTWDGLLLLGDLQTVVAGTWQLTPGLEPITFSAGGAYTLDLALVGMRSNHREVQIVLDANMGVLTTTNAPIGLPVTFTFVQGGGGGFTVNLAGSPMFKWIGGAPPALTAVAGNRDSFTSYFDGAHWFECAGRALNVG